MSFLEDLAGVADSPYGRGVVEKLVRQNQKTRQGVCLSALYLCRYGNDHKFWGRQVWANIADPDLLGAV